MATEIIRIIIRTTGAAAAQRSIAGIGIASRTAGGSVAALTLSLTGLAAILAGREFIQAADKFIQIRNSIRLVLPDAEQANTAFEELRRIANETRVPLDLVATLFRRFGLAIRGTNRNTGELFTVIQALGQAIQIAGATSSEARASLIQFSQGISSNRTSADELRSVLEGLPPVAVAIAESLGIPIGALRRLAEQGRAITRDVALDAIIESVEKFREQFERVTPTVESSFTVLQNEAIVAVGRIDEVVQANATLGKSIRENIAPALGDFLVGAFQAVLTALSEFLRFGAAALRLVSSLGINILDLGRFARLVFNSIQVVIGTITSTLNLLNSGIQGARFAVAALGNRLGLVSDEAFLRSIGKFRTSLNDFDESTKRTGDSFNKLIDDLLDSTIGGDVEKTAAGFEKVADSLEDVNKALDEPFDQDGDRSFFDDPPPGTSGGTGEDEDPAALRDRERATERLVALANRLKIAREEANEPLDAELERLRQTQVEIRSQLEAAGDNAEARQAAARAELFILQDIANIEQRRSDARAGATAAEQEILANLERIRTLNPEIAEQYERQLATILDQGLGVEGLREELEGLGEDLRGGLQREQQRIASEGERLGQAFAQPFSQAVNAALRGEAIDFSDILADLASNALNRSLSTLFESLATDFANFLQDKVGESLRGAGGELFGGALGSAITGALGLGLGILSGALRDTEVTATGALDGTTAVTDVRPVRGIVAGPTEIPIFQVGRELEEALGGTNEILTDILRAIRGSGGLGASLGSDPLDAAAGSALATTSPSLG